MNRRRFILGAALSGSSLSALISSCMPKNKQLTNGSTSDGHLAEAFELNEMTIDQLTEQMRTGHLTSREITMMYLDRIDQLDKTGPAIRAVIELNPDALKIAEAMDKERKEGNVKGPLHGIPVLLKDNIDTADKMMTTAGALAMVGNIATTDAFIVARLRNAGAVILGKTNLSEWANFRSSRSSSGWSSRGGQTKNPYVLDRNPCGSSSGSGVAVAANLCAFAIGTETNGSIACPASINGIVGIKPTVGLWSRAGIIPISGTQDTAGPMARTVREAALVLGALTGADPNDKATGKNDEKAFRDYTKFLNADGLKGARIGIEKKFMKGNEGVDALLQTAIDQMKMKGATFMEVEVTKVLSTLDGEESKVLKYEFKDGLNRYLSSSNAPVRSLHDIIDFNKKNEAKVMRFFKQETLEDCQPLGDLNSADYKTALEKLLSVTRGAIDKILNENHLDAICAPTNGPSWCTDLVNGDAFNGYNSYGPPAIAGYPSVTVPMGLLLELPIGITFYGKAWDEAGLLKIAYAYEQQSKNRRAPKFLPHIDA